MKSPTGRKAARKAARLARKQAKVLHYYKRHGLNHVTGNSVPVRIKNAKTSKKKLQDNNSTDKALKPKVSYNILKEKQPDFNEFGGPTFSNNQAVRMQGLQQFIDNEVQLSKGTANVYKSTPKTLSKSVKNSKASVLIKDKTKLSELQVGIEKDSKEINALCRLMRLKARQKKSNKLISNTFGDDIACIFDMLDSEPSQSDLITEQAIAKSTRKELDAVLCPASTTNVITVDTKNMFTNNVEDPQSANLNGITKCGSDNKQSTLNRKRKRELDESEVMLVSRKKLKQQPLKIKVIEDYPVPSNIKSIIKSHTTGNSQNKDKMNVSFNLDKNDVKLIPGITGKRKRAMFRLSNTYLMDTLGDDCSDSDEDADIDEDDLIYSCLDSDNEDIFDSDNQSIDNCEERLSDADVTESNILVDPKVSCLLSEESEIEKHGKNMQIDSNNHLTKEKSSASKCKTSLKQAQDIFGRQLNEDGNVTEETKSFRSYCSPERRKADIELQQQLNTDALKRVKTQLRGRINRLAEVNLTGTVAMVCGLYKEHPRYLLNVILSELLLAELGNDSPTLERHSQECAALLVAVSANVSQEIGAHLLTDFVVSWHAEDGKADGDTVRKKNLIMFVSHLYCFGFIHSTLISDLLRRLAMQLSASHVDEMVQVLGCVGFQLRKDDPESLKEIILAVNKHSEDETPPQFELLTMMLRAIKNNNESKMPCYDQSYVEYLRKKLKTLISDNVARSCSSVRVTLEDLVQAETRGRWWIVGSAWLGGSPMQEQTLSGISSLISSQTSEFSERFLKMAEKMRITRPPKINILYVLTVGSQNVDEAAVKLKELNLPSTQEKQVFDVLLYCVQKMRVYKPFYSSLCCKQASEEVKNKRLLRNALWDKFSDMEVLKLRELHNLANFVVDIIKENVFDLSVLKTLSLAEAEENVINFLEDVLWQLFDNTTGCHVTKFAFEQLFRSKKLLPFRLQLRLFIQVFIASKLQSNEKVPKTNLFESRLRSALDLLSKDHAVKM